MIAKQDRHGVRTASDLVRRYKFRKKFSETLGVAADARKEAEQAMAETIELSDNISLKATHDIPGKKTIIDLLVDNKKYSGEIDMSDFYTKEEVDEMVGDITIALDHIIELQTENLQKVYDAGYAAGQAAGGDTDAAYQQGVTAGRHAEWDDFWEAHQWSRYCYPYAFSYWNMRNFKPKHDIKFFQNNAASAFYNAGWLKPGAAFDSIYEPFDLAQILDDCGVQLDTYGLQNAYYMFYGCSASRLPSLDFTYASNLNSVFAGCAYLETIDEIIVGLSTSSFSNAFAGCSKLKNLVITGELRKTNQNFTSCSQLTHDSLMSIVNALASYDSGTYKLNLGSTNLGKLTDAEKAIATEKGWTLS